MMAYKTEDLKKQAIEAVEKYKLIFIEEIVHYLPCSKPTFYQHELNESDELKELIEKNKANIKAALRVKWYNTDNATLQLALYRLVSTESERRKLSINYNEHVVKVNEHEKKSDQQIDVEIAELTLQLNGHEKPALKKAIGE